MDGDLTVVVRDPQGLAIEAEVALLSRSSSFRDSGRTDAHGRLRFRRLPVGVYGIEVSASGFETYVETVELPSEIPVVRTLTLRLGSAAETVTVEAAAPLIDPGDPSLTMVVDRLRMEETPFATVGRDVINQVQDLPGWLLEANAVLHPRGSEYDTQYVIDGVPVYDNRSIGFAPGFEVDELETVNVLTAGVPAEFGRRLGGVIELYPKRAGRRGHHPELQFQGGSFTTIEGALADHFNGERTSFSLGVRAGRTDRYLDPPSLENFTNEASSAGFYARLDRDIASEDRLSLYARSNRVGFQVPNDLEQQAAGQRQDRRGAETTGQAHYQKTLSPSWLLSARGMARDVAAELWSNTLSTPVFVNQDRGLREGVAAAALTRQSERHTWKLGGDFRTANVRENFLFAEPDELPEIDFLFDERRRSTEASFFVQDHIRVGRFTVNAGLRFDYYDLLVDEQAWSPRLSAAYYWREADLLIRGAYDRMFQTPPLENLLLSSSGGALGLDAVEETIPVPGSRADFVEIGVRKALGSLARLDVTHYWRDFENYYDDDVFLNTGISFPITFDQAAIEGTEVRFELPYWKGLSSSLSYANMRGTATSPVTGGLFVEGGEAEELRDVVETFPITQDQRNTVAYMLRYEPHPRMWIAARARYGSGLPIELEDDDDDDDDEDGGEGEDEDDSGDDPFAGISDDILGRVNLARGRVRPNFSLDLSVGARIWQRDGRSLRLQIDAVNLTDRLNVINFSGLFSGTALGPTRMIGVRLHAQL